MINDPDSEALIPSLNELPRHVYGVTLLIVNVTRLFGSTVITFGSAVQGIPNTQCRFGEMHHGVYESRDDLPEYVVTAVEGGHRVFFILTQHANRVSVRYETPQQAKEELAKAQ